MNDHVELFLGAINDIYTLTGQPQLDVNGQPINGGQNQPNVQALGTRIIDSNNQLLATLQAPANPIDKDSQEIDFMEMTEKEMLEALHKLQDEN